MPNSAADRSIDKKGQNCNVLVQAIKNYTLWVKKNCATFIFTATLANVGRFFKFFQCRNQKETAHNKNEKFPTVA